VELLNDISQIAPLPEGTGIIKHQKRKRTVVLT